MLLPAIGLAPPPSVPATVVVGPRIWALYAWLFLIGALLLTVATLWPWRGNPLFLVQLAFDVFLDLIAGLNVLRWMVSWRLEADESGVRKVIAGRPGKTLPWDRMKLIKYGVRRRATSGSGARLTYYRVAGFVEIQDRRMWRTMYADSVYYSVNTRALASFTQYLIRMGNRHGVRLKYEEVGILSDEL